ncbi:omptin family outer membrane protease [Sinorhizobium medicae]|nr:omptin family outer membrane protease [Sinorhizobium medicae]
MFVALTTDTDHHWRRNIRFEEKYGPIPFWNLGAEAAYQVNDSTQITLGVDIERFFRKEGDMISNDKGPTRTASAWTSSQSHSRWA